MKKIYLSIITLTCSGYLAGQPIIESDVFNIGLTSTRVISEYQPQPEGGAGVTWDFSDLTSNQELSLELEAPDDIPGFDLVPNATHGISSPSTGEFIFYEINESAMRTLLVKLVPPQQDLELLFDPPRINYIFPLEYNNTYSEPYARATDLGNNITNIEEGTITGTVDGYGTLILPDGTYENVLRVVLESTGTVNVVVGADTIQALDVESTTHSYINSENPLGLLIFESGSVGANFFNLGFYQKAAPVSTSDEEKLTSGVNIYPNPASDRTTIEFELRNPAEVSITLHSIDGRMVKNLGKNSLLTGKHRTEMYAGDLPVGMYVLQISNGAIRESQKLMITSSRR